SGLLLPSAGCPGEPFRTRGTCEDPSSHDGVSAGLGSYAHRSVGLRISAIPASPSCGGGGVADALRWWWQEISHSYGLISLALAILRPGRRGVGAYVWATAFPPSGQRPTIGCRCCPDPVTVPCWCCATKSPSRAGRIRTAGTGHRPTPK